jgi:hypothetical protein
MLTAYVKLPRVRVRLATPCRRSAAVWPARHVPYLTSRIHVIKLLAVQHDKPDVQSHCALQEQVQATVPFAAPEVHDIASMQVTL